MMHSGLLKVIFMRQTSLELHVWEVPNAQEAAILFINSIFRMIKKLFVALIFCTLLVPVQTNQLSLPVVHLSVAVGLFQCMSGIRFKTTHRMNVASLNNFPVSKKGGIFKYWHSVFWLGLTLDKRNGPFFQELIRLVNFYGSILTFSQIKKTAERLLFLHVCFNFSVFFCCGSMK